MTELLCSFVLEKLALKWPLDMKVVITSSVENGQPVAFNSSKPIEKDKYVALRVKNELNAKQGQDRSPFINTPLTCRHKIMLWLSWKII